MNRPVRTIRNSLLIGLPLAISPMFVHAQTENTSGQSGAVLEEIVVTATKRPQSVRDIPTSINAFSGDDLTSIGATTLGDIAGRYAGARFYSEQLHGPDSRHYE